MELRELLRDLKGQDTQMEFAAKVGINQSTVSKLLLGKRIGGRAVIAALLRAYPERHDEIMSVFCAPELAIRPTGMATVQDAAQ
jgi:transcriptional regulator with XRE-family HTH domain